MWTGLAKLLSWSVCVHLLTMLRSCCAVIVSQPDQGTAGADRGQGFVAMQAL